MTKTGKTMVRRLILSAGIAWSALASSALAQTEAEFLGMKYEGSNPAEDAIALRPVEFRNPILPGFQPDPSIVRVGRDYYVVNSSFGWLPGLPIFHSRDLVNWQQIGNAITSTEYLKVTSGGINRAIFAPTIRFNNGLFHIITTCIECGGNFIITAKRPEGPWSKPVWLDAVTGIDPDLFFDDDGRIWITNNDEPAGKADYDGHRALWIQEYDPAQQKMVGKRSVIVDRGVKPEEKPIWAEGPHIFKKDSYYYLTAAEGGTSDDHRQTIYRSASITGPYVPGPINPILTQRNLDPARSLPVYATGHADFVQLPNEDWWAVFLATRPYEPNLTNLGRETFLLPVTWKNGWPEILPSGVALPLRLKKPDLPHQSVWSKWSRWTENFDGTKLGSQWLMQKDISSDWISLSERPGSLILRGGGDNFIGQRQRHRMAVVSTEVRFTKVGRAGLSAIADKQHQIFFGIQRTPSGTMLIVSSKGRKDAPNSEEILIERPLATGSEDSIRLRMTINGGSAEFDYAVGNADWITIMSGADARILATEYDSLLFTGTVVGLYTGS
jgi:xylan 1,4-beta-xylosidase